MFFSVIVPNYNHSRYLRERLDSIISQTINNYEIIILDDCSSDDSSDIIECYRHDDHVSAILYNDENSGSTFLQWKKGFSMAKGDFIWIAESDDSIKPTFLEEAQSAISKYPEINLFFCNSNFIDDKGELWSVIDYDYDDPFANTGRITIEEGKSFILKYMLFRNRIYNASAVVFKRSCLDYIDKGYMDYILCGDWYFWNEILCKGKVGWLHKRLNYFRIHDLKVTSSAKLKGINIVEGIKQFEHLRKRIHISRKIKWLVLGQYFFEIFTTSNIKKVHRLSLLHNVASDYPLFLLYMFARLIQKCFTK